MNQAYVSVENLAKQYFPGAPAIFDQLSFTMEKGEFVCILGHSGCGKTTILNLLAGLETPSAGRIVFNGKDVSGPGLERGVVFQGHALLPWLSVLSNVSFAIKSRWPGWSREKIEVHAMRYIHMVGLEAASCKMPYELSGGMKQRVGIARAFAIEPGMLLLDEPFGALDALTRGVIQDELLRICAETAQTVFMVTHDVDESILLADRIILMTAGPMARIAEIVANPLPKTRTRAGMHRMPHFYELRNYLVEFLVHRYRIVQAQGLHADFEAGAGLQAATSPLPQHAA